MSSMNRPQDAMEWLTSEGYAEAGDTGWTRIVRAPAVGPTGRYRLRDLHTFVACIKMLGAHSVQGASSELGRVECSRGVDGDEILFRLRK